ncbi:MAG: winged helix-turn-helix transcriptional regulator [Nanoarchaeota archaeon]
MVVTLKPTDKKLLAHIYHNSREPATKIARAIHLSREQVAYRIKKFEKEGLIKGYIPLVSYSRLGYHSLTLLFLKFNKQNQIQEFKNTIRKSSFRINTATIMAKYDLGVMFVFKNEKERNEQLTQILQNYNSEISDYFIFEPNFSEFFPLKFLNAKEMPVQKMHEYKQEEYVLDEKEKKILSVLNENANLPLIEISKKTSISAELLVYKIKKLKEEKVLLSTRAYFNMEKIGHFYSILLITLHSISENSLNKLKQFARQNEFIDSLMTSFGKPNVYIQIFHKNLEDLHKTISDLNAQFQNEQIAIEILPLKNEGEDINALPFL